MVFSSSVTTTEPGVTKSPALPASNFEDGDRSRPLFASSSQARRPPSSCPPSPQHQEPDSSPSTSNVTSQPSDFSLFAFSSPFSTASSFATTSPVSAYLPALISPTSSASPSTASRVGFPSVSLADLTRLQPPGMIRGSTRAAKKQQPSPPSTPVLPSSIICSDTATAYELRGDVASAGRLARGGSSTTSSPSSSVRRMYGERRSGFPSTRRRSREPTNGGAGPPKDYIVHQLRRLAPMFWRNPASSDCRLLVQMHMSRAPNLGPGSSGGGASTGDPLHSEKNTTQRGPDNTTETSCLSYATHRDYLTTQSSLLRRLFSESSTESSTSLPTQTRFSSTALPRLSDEDKPTVLLTLPDPHSFNLILHYLYWGDGQVVTEALVSGKVDWMGLFNNIEYLGLDNPIKTVCAAWWRKRIKPHSFAAAAVSSAVGTNAHHARPELPSELPPPRVEGLAEGAFGDQKGVRDPDLASNGSSTPEPALEGDFREGIHKVFRDLGTPNET